MQSYLEPLLHRLDTSTAKARQDFASLDSRQLNWKANPDQWSVGQCLDHLITTNELYEEIFTQIKTGSYQPGFWPKLGLFSGYLGRMLVQSLGPEVKRKSKSPPNFQPSQSEIADDILDRFLRHQENLKAQLQSLPDQDHQKVLLSSPAAAFITYSLYDAVHIIVGHEERHLKQARNVMKETGFPT